MLIDGRFRIDREIGAGGMGRVYAGWQVGLERPVAVKIMRSELALHAEAIARFRREAQAIAQLDSVNVVRVYDAGSLPTGEPWVAMELLEGEDLAQRIARGPLSPDKARAYLAAACAGLAEAHAIGIVHRDLKPSNLFVTRDERVVVLDFGLAKLASASAGVTHTGIGLGTPQFVAPEQIDGARDVDARADVYSLGATLLAMCDPLPADLAAIALRATSVDPAARYANAAELRDSLRGGTTTALEIVGEIGRGGHGVVYRARLGGREVAVKVLHDQTQRDRFARETAIARRLEHPNSVRMLDAGVNEHGAPYVVFELVRGRTLASEIARGALAVERVAVIASGVLKALMEAHALGVVHRDVTPANVLLVDHAGSPDFPKLLDFGVARDADSPALTSTGQLAGTPRYMAPEQVAGGAVDGRADLYALGLVMAEALSGAPVFQGSSAIAVCVAQVSEDPAPIPPAVLAGPLGGVIGRATQKDPANRYSTAGEMLGAISEGAGTGRGTGTIRGTEPVRPPSKWPLVVIGAAVVAIVGAVVFAVTRGPVENANDAPVQTEDRGPRTEDPPRAKDQRPKTKDPISATVPPGWRLAPELATATGLADVWIIRPIEPTPKKAASTIIVTDLNIEADALVELAKSDDAACQQYAYLVAPANNATVQSSRAVTVGTWKGCEVVATTPFARAPLHQHSWSLTDGSSRGAALVCSRDVSGDAQVDDACAAVLPTIR